MHAIERWSAPPDNLQPPTDTIHLWRIKLDGAVESMLHLLSMDEQQRARRLNSAQARDPFIRARGAMRAILGRYLDSPPQRLRFNYGDKGKPYLQNPSANVQFNLSHADKLALLAVSPAPVGIDLEQLRERKDLARVATRMFPPSIAQDLAKLQGDALIRAFFYHWTYLESCSKCRGTGLFGPRDDQEHFFTTHFTFEQDWISCLASTEPVSDISNWDTFQY
jgi:4'-phosphopantetheinyl transferase